MNRFACAFALTLLSVAIGCATTPSQPSRKAPPASSKPSPAPNLDTDPCATRLHEISGLLLLYYGKQHHLPQTLADLADTPGFSAVGALACPTSHQPYTYNPDGIQIPSVPGTVVVYDPVPIHAGYRWAIIVVPSDGPLITKVIALPKNWTPQF
jgi:hypothetical protein